MKGTKETAPSASFHFVSCHSMVNILSHLMTIETTSILPFRNIPSTPANGVYISQLTHSSLYSIFSQRHIPQSVSDVLIGFWNCSDSVIFSSFYDKEINKN